MQISLLRLGPLVGVVLVILAAASVVAAPPALRAAPNHATDETIRFVARPAYDGVFRPGSWMPVIVKLENAGVDRVVEVRVGTREGAQYATRVDLPNGGRKAVTLYAYLTPASRRLTARLLSDGEELATQPIALQPVNPNARVLAIVAPSAGVRPPARIDNFTPLTAITLQPADLPDHPLGLSSFGAVLLEDVVTADLSDRQRAALRQWVLRGGQLILGGGPGLERTLVGLPAELAPARPGPAAPVAAESLFGPDAAGLPAIPFLTLTPQPTAQLGSPYPLPLASLTSQQLPALEQAFGRGSVTVLAFPLGHPALLAWERGPQLWAELVRPNSELPAGFAPEHMSVDSFVEGNLASSLTSLPALEFPPLGLLTGLVALYVLLVGPGTYLVLRRIDRLALGWVVVPAITLLFAALTYSIGLAQRGGDVVVNQIALIEPVPGTGEARVRTFVGLFSPDQRSYSLQAAGAAGEPPLLRPISVQGPWDASGGAAGGIFLQDTGPGPAADDLAVAQWSIRAIAADAILRGPALDARLVVDGATLTGEATNGGATALRDVALIQGDLVARLGDLAPGETKRAELRRRQGVKPGGFIATIPVSYLVYGDEIEQQGKVGGAPLPLATQQRMRILDALFNYGPSNRGGQPLFIAWTDQDTLGVTLGESRANIQRTAIITGAPRIDLVGAETQLGVGWLATRFEGGATTACFGAQGIGVNPGPDPAVIRLALPRDLYELRPSRVTLLLGSDGPWLNDTTVELYDWTTGSWEQQPMPAREIAVAAPARFFGGNGSVRVRVGGGQPQPGLGCVYVDASIQGALP